MAVTLHKGDLPADLDFGSAVAVDTETQGLLGMATRISFKSIVKHLTAQT